MDRVDERRRSPATLLMLGALVVACAALAVSLGGKATGTIAESSKVGKVREYFKTVTIPDGEKFGGAEARCKKGKAISGGFGYPPETGAYVWSSTRSSKRKWEVTLENPPGGSAVELTVIVYCAK